MTERDTSREQAARNPDPTPAPEEGQAGQLVAVGETSRGYKLYREPNEVGGHRYWSDSIGGGVVIWDTSLASVEELEMALQIEKQHPS